MNTAKKIKIETLPQDYSPSTLPEILKLAKKIKGDMALIYERTNKPFFMETDRLIIRRFTTEDAEAVLALSLDRMNSSMKDFDHQWPTDLEGCKGAAAYFADNDNSYAVCLKPSMKLIGYISYNSVTDDGVLDLGHVWHTAYQNNDHDAEALSLMAQYAFEKLGVNGVTAGNPLDCEEQIAPLKSFGMEVVEIREKASFVNDVNGNPIEFTGCKMLITKKQWETGNPESYSPKNKPVILNMMEDTQQIEKLVQTISYKGINFEVVERPDVLWVGCLDFANNNIDESDSNKTLSRYQEYFDIIKQDLINPDWSASLWVNYGCDDKPHGQMFAQETYSANQDERYEVFTQPGGLWLRLRRSKESSLTLFGNESIDAWDYFINGVLQNAAEENGYRVNPDVHVRIGYDCHAEYNTPPHTCYAYMPVIESPESYSPKNKPEILNMMESVKGTDLRYPPQYRIKQKNKTAAYTGARWPHSNAYPAMFSAISLFYGKEIRLNEKGEQINDDLQYHIQTAISTEAYGVQYSELFEDDHLQNCLGMYGIKSEVVDCSDWTESKVRDFVCTAVASDKTVIIEPKEYKDMHFVFGYGENGKTLFCCPFLDGDDKKNCAFNFSKYYKRKNRTAHVKRLITLEDTGETLQPREVYRQSLKQAYKMMTTPSLRMDFNKLIGAGTGIYDAWITLLKQANSENSDVYYMEFPVFPQFIILYENRLHFCEFLKECNKIYGEFPDLTNLIGKCEEVRDLVFEDAEYGFHKVGGDPKYQAMTNNERRSLLIGVLKKCRKIDQEAITLLQKVCEVL